MLQKQSRWSCFFYLSSAEYHQSWEDSMPPTTYSILLFSSRHNRNGSTFTFHHHRSQISVFNLKIWEQLKFDHTLSCHLYQRAAKHSRIVVQTANSNPVSAPSYLCSNSVPAWGSGKSGPTDMHCNKVIYCSGDMNYFSSSEQKHKLLQ